MRCKFSKFPPVTDSYHCDWKRCMMWNQPSWNCNDLFCSPTCSLCWRMSRVPHEQSVLLFSRPVVSNSLRPLDCMQHASFPVLHRLLQLDQTHIQSQWPHPTILLSVVRFSSCLQSFPASGSIPVSWLFASRGQSIGASASASVPLMNIQDWLPFGLVYSII